VELHFTPQALEISFATMWQDIPVAVFDFKDLPNILKYFELDPNTRFRDGHTTGYRKSPVLEKMTVEDYDHEMLKDLCKLYEVDVVMQRHVGLKVPLCDPYVPRWH